MSSAPFEGNQRAFPYDDGAGVGFRTPHEPGMARNETPASVWERMWSVTATRIARPGNRRRSDGSTDGNRTRIKSSDAVQTDPKWLILNREGPNLSHGGRYGGLWCEHCVSKSNRVRSGWPCGAGTFRIHYGIAFPNSFVGLRIQRYRRRKGQR